MSSRRRVYLLAGPSRVGSFELLTGTVELVAVVGAPEGSAVVVVGLTPSSVSSSPFPPQASRRKGSDEQAHSASKCRRNIRSPRGASVRGDASVRLPAGLAEETK